MIAQMQIVAAAKDGTEKVIGYIQEDGRGHVAWDHRAEWLGKTDRSRFASEDKALSAIQAAYEASVGTTVRLLRMEVAPRI